MKALSIVLFLVIVCSGTSKGQNRKKTETSPFVLGIVDKIKSVALHETRVLNIYLPPGYDTDLAATYPVIYLLDGSADEDFVHICGIVQFLTMIKAMPNTIVVGIANVDRRRDFTFPTSIDSDRKAYPTTGGSANFIAFLDKELLPYILDKYRANGHKTIIGESLGGLLATEILLKSPTLFDDYIIVSPSLWWNHESLLAAPNHLRVPIKRNIQIYISVGDEGATMEEDANKLAEAVTRSGNNELHLTYMPMPAENHLTILHNTAYKGLLLLNKK